MKTLLSIFDWFSRIRWTTASLSALGVLLGTFGLPESTTGWVVGILASILGVGLSSATDNARTSRQDGGVPPSSFLLYLLAGVLVLAPSCATDTRPIIEGEAMIRTLEQERDRGITETFEVGGYSPETLAAILEEMKVSRDRIEEIRSANIDALAEIYGLDEEAVLRILDAVLDRVGRDGGQP